MPKIAECDCALKDTAPHKASRRHRCLFYAATPYMVCAVHPEGVNTDRCLDFRLDPNKEPQEQWSPQGYSFYDGELGVELNLMPNCFKSDISYCND